MVIANGIFKQVRYKKQTAFATIASTTGGQQMRRVTSDIELSKDSYRSNEIRTDQQRGDSRHGMRKVGGKIAGELTVGTHKDFFESFCRQTWQAPATTGALTTVAAASTTGTLGTFTRTGGSYLTDGFKVGDVVRPAGFATTGVPNNGKNMVVTALSATVMTVSTLDGSAVGPKAAGDSVTIAMPGKKTWVPASGHTNDCYTIEHFYSDIGTSETFDSCRIASVDIGMPATGLATIDWTFMGRDMTPGEAAYFPSPTASTTGRGLAAVNGLLIVAGVVVGLLTGMTLTGSANASTGEVVGSNVTPDVFVGAVDVSGQLTVYFVDSTYRDMFVNETEVSLVAVLTADNTPGAAFQAYSMPRVKVNGATKDDGEKGLVMTMPFVALANDAPATGTLYTTFAVQDSSVV